MIMYDIDTQMTDFGGKIRVHLTESMMLAHDHTYSKLPTASQIESIGVIKAGGQIIFK